MPEPAVYSTLPPPPEELIDRAEVLKELQLRLSADLELAVLLPRGDPALVGTLHEWLCQVERDLGYVNAWLQRLRC